MSTTTTTIADLDDVAAAKAKELEAQVKQLQAQLDKALSAAAAKTKKTTKKLALRQTAIHALASSVQNAFERTEKDNLLKRGQAEENGDELISQDCHLSIPHFEAFGSLLYTILAPPTADGADEAIAEWRKACRVATNQWSRLALTVPNRNVFSVALTTVENTRKRRDKKRERAANNNNTAVASEEAVVEFVDDIVEPRQKRAREHQEEEEELEQ